MPSDSAGSTTFFQSPIPELGSHPNWTANTSTATSAIQNPGMHTASTQPARNQLVW